MKMNGEKVKCAPETYRTYNVVSSAILDILDILAEHRNNFYRVIEGAETDEINDDLSLGLHFVQ